MKKPTKKTQYVPRLTVELPIEIRHAFKVKCYAEETTMHDKILELIQIYLEN